MPALIGPVADGLHKIAADPCVREPVGRGVAGALRLIEQVGMKGMVHGKAKISERHANFIVNLGSASATDVVALIKEARSRVHEKFGVDLELEVEPRGEWGKSGDSVAQSEA